MRALRRSSAASRRAKDRVSAIILGLSIPCAAGRGEIRKQIQRERIAAAHAGRPDDDSRAREIGGGLGRVVIAEFGRPRGPGIAEARKIIIDVEHDRRNFEQRGFLDDPPKQHGLAGA